MQPTVGGKSKGAANNIKIRMDGILFRRNLFTVLTRYYYEWFRRILQD